jgi:hypothetical protein
VIVRNIRDAQTFQKCRCHRQILGAKRAIRSNFHIEDPQILGATVQNSVAMAIWRPGFVHPCVTCILFIMVNVYAHEILNTPTSVIRRTQGQYREMIIQDFLASFYVRIIETRIFSFLPNKGKRKLHL